MLPKRFPDRDEIAAVGLARTRSSRARPTSRSSSGWPGVLARREMGKITFLDLVDRSGRIQLLAPRSTSTSAT